MPTSVCEWWQTRETNTDFYDINHWCMDTSITMDRVAERAQSLQGSPWIFSSCRDGEEEQV